MSIELKNHRKAQFWSKYLKSSVFC